MGAPAGPLTALLRRWPSVRVMLAPGHAQRYYVAVQPIGGHAWYVSAPTLHAAAALLAGRVA